MMKKTMKTMLGVTLLEIMLVLAIAAMVIVLSIKYYQSAASSSQANAIMGALQSITAAADNIAQGTGTYTGVTEDKLKTILPATTFISPWGSTLTFKGATSSFTVSVPSPPGAVCTLITPKFASDSHTSGSTCATTNGITYTYVANP